MKRFLAVSGFFAFILCVIYEANSHGTNYVFRSVENIPYKDKIGHFGLYGLLAALLDYALRSRNYYWKSRAIPMALVWVMGFAILEEISQYWIPTRDCDYKDALADLLGVLLFVKSWRFLYKGLSQLLTLLIGPPKKTSRTQNNGWYC